MTETTEAPVSVKPEEQKTPEQPEAAAENGSFEAQDGEESPKQNGSEQGKEDAKEAKEEKSQDPPKEMRAIVLTGFGGYKGVKILKKPEPQLQAGEVLIRVKACGLNFQDLMVRLGAIDSPPKTPCIMGFECAGEIEAIGEEVENLKVGDRVVALPEFRAWAELVAVSEKYVYKIPEAMSYSDAAAILMNYLVAYVLVHELAALQPGKSILLHSSGGGVGQAIAQLCRNIDNVTVFGTASKNKQEALKANGLIDHLLERGSDYCNEVRKVCTEGVDVVFDCLCGEECNKGYNLLKPMGKYILYGSSNVVTGETKSFFSLARSWWQVDKVSPIKLFDENKTLAGFNLRHLLYQQSGADYVRNIVERVFKLWSDGKIKPAIDSTWAFEDVAEAMQKMHDRKNIGKLILDPAQEPKPKPATPAKGKAKDKKQASEDKEKKAESGDDKKEEGKEEGAAAATNGGTEGEGDAPKSEEEEAKPTNGDAAEAEKQS